MDVGGEEGSDGGSNGVNNDAVRGIGGGSGVVSCREGWYGNDDGRCTGSGDVEGTEGIPSGGDEGGAGTTGAGTAALNAPPLKGHDCVERVATASATRQTHKAVPAMLRQSRAEQERRLAALAVGLTVCSASAFDGSSANAAKRRGP